MEQERSPARSADLMSPWKTLRNVAMDKVDLTCLVSDLMPRY